LLTHSNAKILLRCPKCDELDLKIRFVGIFPSSGPSCRPRTVVGPICEKFIEDHIAAGRDSATETTLRSAIIFDQLSRIDVAEGQRVAAGDRLGLSGATGRVTGPHLHWAVRWQDAYLDPAKLLRLDLNGMH
jgi:hypothetical protein